MKKLLYCAAALAMALFAGSCQQEKLEPVAGNGTVTFTVEAPANVQTKAIANGLNVNELVYEVWLTEEPGQEELFGVKNAERLYQGKTTMKVEDDGTNKASVTLDLVNDQNFTVLFWAQVNTPEYPAAYNTKALTKVTYAKDEYKSNDENLAAFYSVAFVKDCSHIDTDGKSISSNVTLRRPFAQLNIGTTNSKKKPVDGSLPTDNYTVELVSSAVEVTTANTIFNVSTGAVSGNRVVTFSDAKVPDEVLMVQKNGKDEPYEYVAMNYLFAGSNASVEYDIVTKLNGNDNVTATINNTVDNVPLKENYRTNIIGNLLTSDVDYQIVVDAGFYTNENSGNIEVLGEGVVMHQNGDYEISNARGLAYAINELMSNGGDFYLTAAEYDMTGIAVNSLTIASNVTLNIYGEAPVVTRSTTTIGGATIIGLGNLIDTIAEGGSVSISGVELSDDQSILVKTNNGTLVVSNSEAGKLVESGNEPVHADDVKDIARLNTALASDVKTIEITGDIETNAVVEIGRTVVINGNGHTFTTSANRAFRLTTSDIEVTFNNLNIVSTAVMIYPSDVRGVAIDPNLSNVVLTLNDCTIDFTDKTTNDWTYAVNVAGNGTGHKVTVNGGTYEGANVINVYGAKNVITVKNAVLNCLYANSDMYYGSCIWVLQNQGSSVYAEGNTFNGYNAIAFNLGTGTALEEKDNTNNTMYYSPEEKCYYVTSVEKLQYAANNISKSCVIKFYNDLAGDVTLVQRPDIDIEINGEGLKYDGTITIDGDNRNEGTEVLTIKNIKFESETPKTFVSAPGSLNGKNERYSHNVTVEDCSFYTPVYNEKVGAISTQKTYHFAVKNCSVENMHSLLQVQSCDNDVTVKNVKITNCKNGISFGNTASPVLKGAEINVIGYGVRADANENRGNLVVENATITAETPIFIRKVASKEKKYTADFSNNVTLNFNGKYAAVFTNGTDDLNALATPTGLYEFTGADNLPVYPRDFSVSTVEDLKAANSFEGTVYVVNDLIVSTKWDFKKNGGLFTKPVTIEGMDHTIKFSGEISNGNGNYAFEFEKAAVVKNLKMDLSETPSNLTTAISAKSSISVDNSEFIGNPNASRYGIIFGQGASHTDNKIDMEVSIKNSTFTDWKRRGISDNEAARDFKSVVIEGNTCTNANVYVSAYDSIVFKGNVMNDCVVNLTSYTSASTAKVTATGNTLYDSEYNVIGAPNRKFSAANVEAQEGFTVYAE
jgi:hypothetical protein